MTIVQTSRPSSSFDVHRIREEFPILDRFVNGKPLAYLDCAATSQKPRAVLEAMHAYYTRSNANVHRGVHALSVEATDLYEGARNRLRRFIGASDDREVIFTRGATEAINIVAACWGRAHLAAGDEVILSNLEHHSNIVPWQMLRDATGITLHVIPVNDAGELDLHAYANLLTSRTRLVAVQHVSNALGTINPLQRMVSMAHDAGALVSVDGAQAAPHLSLDMQAIQADFYAVSGHKMYGPTGTGLLYARRELLEAMPPWLGGGDMIKSVTFEKTIYNDLPNKFEAGTPNIAGVIGLAAAAEFLESVGLDTIAAHEHSLLERTNARLLEIDSVRLIGTAAEKAAVVSFNVGEIHPHDVGTILDAEGIAVRTGHHCAQPLMERFDVAATVRASFGMYNTIEEVDRLADGIDRVIEVFGE